MSSRVCASALLAVALLSSAQGCGHTRRPKEVDVSAVPPEVLAAFRRAQPNSTILGHSQVRDRGPGTVLGMFGSGAGQDAWRLDYFTPRNEKEWILFTPEGDKIRGSE